MPQAASKKRPAPGASPVDKAEAGATNSYEFLTADPSNPDQYLQWDQNNPLVASFNNHELPKSEPSQDFPNMNTQTVRAEPANQLTRRPGTNQVMPRAPYNGGGGDLWAGQWPNTQQPPQQSQAEQGVQNVVQPDDDAQLDRRAAEAKKQAQAARKSIPPFVQKLSSFLDEKRNTELIRWSPKGDSFVVLDEDEFARTLIPELFKHNNYASFVRQLNMYGFHKRVGLSDNSMRASERKNKSPSEYFNPFFKRGRPNLLWLIQKPKPSTQGRKRGGKQEDNADDDGEDIYDGDNLAGGGHGDEQIRGPRQPLLLGSGEAGLAREELSQVHQELQNIRQQQQMISGVITKIRREHEQLYGQAAAFQELHSRHENSINAILTFLATVYNRSLEGNQNLGNLFAGTIPHDVQQQGSVVDMGDYRSPSVETQGGLVRRPSKKPLLLHAPPNGDLDGKSGGDSMRNINNNQSRPQSGSSQSPSGYQNPQHARVVEEIYDPEPNTPTQPKYNAGTPQSQTQDDFMSFINSANAQNNGNLPGRMEFPEALSHLQNADGKSPLSPAQRNNVLRLIAGNNGQQTTNGSTNNALISPEPPSVPTPNLDKWNSTDQDLKYLEQTLKEQGDKVDQLSNMLQPLSPSGSIPGLDNPNEYMPPPEGLDFNQIFNDDYFANAANNDIDFGTAANDFTNNNDFSFDNNNNLGPAFGVDGADDNGRVVETVDSSEATSPANTVAENGLPEDEPTSPRKRRRRN